MQLRVQRSTHAVTRRAVPGAVAVRLPARSRCGATGNGGHGGIPDCRDIRDIADVMAQLPRFVQRVDAAIRRSVQKDELDRIVAIGRDLAASELEHRSNVWAATAAAGAEAFQAREGVAGTDGAGAADASELILPDDV
jgi:hypothetical protein